MVSGEWLPLDVYIPAHQKGLAMMDVNKWFYEPASPGRVEEEHLKDFCRRELGNVSGFVLFDENSRYQIELPAAW